MRRLIWHYMLCANVRWMPLMYAVLAVAVIVLWPKGDMIGIDAATIKTGYMLVLMLIAPLGWIVVACALENAEFASALPFSRRRLFIAQTAAVLLIHASLTAPLIAATGMPTRVKELCPDAWVYGMNVTLLLMALTLIAILVHRLVQRRPMMLRVAAIAVILVVGMAIFTTLTNRETGPAPALAFVVVGAVSWYLGMRQFERFEAAPPCVSETRLSRQEVDSVIPVAAFGGVNPLTRVLARSVWLRWTYLLLLVYLGGFVFLGAATRIDLASALLPTFYVSILFPFFVRRLLPYVSRRTAFRAFFVPVAVVPLLAAFLATVAADSAEKLLCGLLAVFLLLFMTWAGLPSRSDYRRTSLWKLRHAMWAAVFLVLLVPAILSRHAELNNIGPWLDPIITLPLLLDPWFQALLMIAGTVLFWRLAERKFNYYEPSSAPQKTMAGG